ncbi:MAG: hypothetical protein HQL84_05105 [Magnetococcales bacterium]|nr:hypothetical protein [Magnetococcales bacterium]MBF0149408.1 hypothetical protein [Magnetococcales bacterium]MBF0171944.1 hypothetical protein [Magnetococcales bacterium]MBF0348630.1 hypothetical protein [Magnetococcales bacterium]MBF0631211.1 hypothetical protein [Magnetococcales bacterium]
MWFKRIISTQYTGLCNRLEGLALCFAFQELFGHQVCLDWPDIAGLEVAGARRWKYTLLDKWMGYKVRDPDAATFHRLGRHRVLIQRGTTGGDQGILERLYRPTMARLRLHPDGRKGLRSHLSRIGNAMLVGVHIRRGDFLGGEEDHYDIHASRHPRVPLWWYIHAMEQVRQRFGHVVFLLSHNSPDGAEEGVLRERFKLLPSLADGRYNANGGHAATTNPVIDLFALACCPVIITTPMSTFSHFAANVLGPPSLAIQPLPVMHRAAPGLGITCLFGQRSPAWFSSLKQGTAFQPMMETAALPDPGSRVHLDWL